MPIATISSKWRCGKSSPITAITETLRVKYEAAREMNDADPPSKSLCGPNGPSMSSSASEPTMSRERWALRACMTSSGTICVR